MTRLAREAQGCADFRALSRRGFLAAAGSALTLPDLFRSRAQAAPGPGGAFGKARAVIILYLHGGHAQQETWDPKPDGPWPERGEFSAISTSVPGVHVSELLPHSARIMHRLSVIRSLTHTNANHVQASLAALTGHHHPPGAEARGDFPPSPSDFPAFGAVLSSLRPAKKLPSWVQIGPLMRRANGTILHGQSPGFLGGRFSPLAVDQDLLPPDTRIESVTPNADLSATRLSQRQSVLEIVDAERRLLDQAAEARTFDIYQQKALNLLTSSSTARAFNLSAEPASVRAAYGATEFGQRCLLARRLTEAGVPIVNVHFCRTPTGSWDTHGRHFSTMKDTLCPIFDRAFATLVSDLDQRGLLGEVLVLATAEFGRTPRINSSSGRDHWPWVYSVALAGGGTAPGVVYGASDRIAAYPVAKPHDPADLAATVYHLLGVPEETWIQDQTQRPHALILGKPIQGLLA